MKTKIIASLTALSVIGMGFSACGKGGAGKSAGADGESLGDLKALNIKGRKVRPRRPRRR